jgi:hypothetical protein
MDHHIGARHPGGGGAVPGSAAADESVRAGAQGGQRIGAALIAGARIVLAHRGGQRGEPLIEHRPVMGEQDGLDVGGLSSVLCK